MSARFCRAWAASKLPVLLNIAKRTGWIMHCTKSVTSWSLSLWLSGTGVNQEGFLYLSRCNLRTTLFGNRWSSFINLFWGQEAKSKREVPSHRQTFIVPLYPPSKDFKDNSSNTFITKTWIVYLDKIECSNQLNIVNTNIFQISALTSKTTLTFHYMKSHFNRKLKKQNKTHKVTNKLKSSFHALVSFLLLFCCQNVVFCH